MTTDSIERTLGRIEGALISIQQDIKTVKASEMRNSQRLGSLERWRAFLAGAWVVTSALLVYIAKELHIGP